jgi:hypothetical protein
MPTKAPDWFKTIPFPQSLQLPLPRGACLPCAFVDTDDPWITIVAAVPDDGGRWTIDVGMDGNHDNSVTADEYGTTASFIQEPGQVRLSIGDMKSKPPGSPRFFRARKVS